MRWNLRLYQLFLILLSFLLIGIASQFLPTIIEKRNRYQLTQNSALENAPPQLVIATTALGGLRGFIIDYLWMRTTELRNQGSHYEIIQLYDWISKLEPRIPDVWSFIAWEMAYNISETMLTPEERWRWVHKGIQQLRDHGIVYNRNTPNLYWELGFMIYNKIEMNAVQIYRHYFFLRWFQFWNEILGAEFDIESIANAPTSQETLLRLPMVSAVIQAIQEKAQIQILQDFYRLENFPEASRAIVNEIFGTPEYAEASQIIIAYIIRQRLQKDFQMNPQKMLSIVKKYGKIDWRIPSSHSLYWIEEGQSAIERIRATSGKKLSTAGMEALQANMDRMQHAALQQNFEYGTFLAITPQRVACIPNFNVLDALQDLCEHIQTKWGLEEGRESHETFLRRAICKCYLYNRKEYAKKYFLLLKTKFPNNADYKLDADTFVVREIGRSINFAQPHIVENYIVANQIDAYRSLLSGNLEKYDGLNHLIMMIYRRYVERHEQNPDNAYINPRPLEYFQKTAFKVIEKNIESMYGEKSEIFWKEAENKFPIFIKLRKAKD